MVHFCVPFMLFSNLQGWWVGLKRLTVQIKLIWGVHIIMGLSWNLAAIMPLFPINFAPGYMGRKPPIPWPVLFTVESVWALHSYTSNRGSLTHYYGSFLKFGSNYASLSYQLCPTIHGQEPPNSPTSPSTVESVWALHSYTSNRGSLYLSNLLVHFEKKIWVWPQCQKCMVILQKREALPHTFANYTGFLGLIYRGSFLLINTWLWRACLPIIYK